MPTLNLLLLPLIGGFIFINNWYPTKYHALRADGYRLFFSSAIAGALMLFLAFLLQPLLLVLPPGEWTAQHWRQVIEFPYLGRSTMAFLLGAVLWKPGNQLGLLPGRWFRWFADNACVDRAIRKKNDPLEICLRKALGKGLEVIVTLKSGKVYTGFIKSNFNPAFAMESISLKPSMSGYRDAQLKVQFTNDYAASLAREQQGQREAEQERQLLAHRLGDGWLGWLWRRKVELDTQKKLAELEDNSILVVFPVSELQSISFYSNKYDVVAEPHELSAAVAETLPVEPPRTGKGRGRNHQSGSGRIGSGQSPAA